MDKKKKALMVEAIREVGDSLFSLEIAPSGDAKERLDGLNKDMAVLSKEKADAENRLTDMQAWLQSIDGPVTSLELKQADIEQKIDALAGEQEALEAKVLMLKNEDELDREVEELQYTSGRLQGETAPLMEKLKQLGSDKESISELKNNLIAKMETAVSAIRVLEGEIPDLRVKARDMELQIQVIGESEQKCNEVKKESTNLENELKQAEGSMQEIKGLNGRKKVLQDQLTGDLQEKKRLADKIEEMSSRKERTESLNAALEEATGEGSRLTLELQDLEEKLQIAGKEGNDLEVELGNIKQEKADLQKKRSDLDRKSGPILDAINSVKKFEEAAEKAKDEAEQVTQDVHKRKSEIPQLELEKTYYKKALDEVKASIGGA